MEDTRFEDFTGLISAIAKEVQRIKSAESARLGLTGADIMCLYYLGKHPEGMTGAELARAAGVTRAAVSRTLARMEREGFVESGIEATDTKYRTPIRLTERGSECARGADVAIGRVLDEMCAALTDEERMQMYASLRSVLGSLKGISRE
jgi:DNA-binding MarR family transcriptional regulator